MNKIDEMIRELCPEGVKRVKLGEVCRFQNGFAFKSDKFREDGEPILRITNIGDGYVNLDNLVYFDIEDYKENLERYTVNKNAIVIAMSGATTGKIGINKTDSIFYLNQRVGMFLPKDGLDNRFLYYILLLNSNRFYLIAGGGAQPNLSSKEIERFEIPLPPLAIQQEIVSILDSFSFLQSKLEEELAVRQKQMEFYREKLLTFDKDDNSVKWMKVSEIADVSDYVANGSFASLRENVAYLQDDGYAILVRTTDLANNFSKDLIYIDESAYDFLSKSQLFGGEIIINNIGAGVGTTYLCPFMNKKMNLGPNAIMVNTPYNRFYYYWFCSNIGQQSIMSVVAPGAMPKFNKTGFRKLYIPIPPLSRQQEIVSTLDTMSSLIDKLKEEIELRKKQYEYYREALLSF